MSRSTTALLADSSAPPILPPTTGPGDNHNDDLVLHGDHFLVYGWSKLTESERDTCKSLPALIKAIADFLNGSLLMRESSCHFFVGYRIGDRQSDDFLELNNQFSISLCTAPHILVNRKNFANETILSPHGLPNMAALQRANRILQWLANDPTRYAANSHNIFLMTQQQSIAEYMRDLNPNSAGHCQKIRALLRGVCLAAFEQTDPGHHLRDALTVGKTPNTLSTFGVAVTNAPSFLSLITSLQPNAEEADDHLPQPASQ